MATHFFALETAKESVDWSAANPTLVLPSLGIGNVGQLALDLFISSLALPLVGHLESPYVVPVIGNDAFTEGEGRLATALDVYYYREKALLLVQQRSPVLEGKHNAFAASLVAWFASVSLAQVLFLTSTDAAFRFHEAQLSGTQMRYLAFNGHTPTTEQGQEQDVGTDKGVPNATVYAQRAQALQWRECEAESVGEVLKRGTVSQKLYTTCRHQNLPILVVTLFCAEGNNIPEGTLMASLLAALLEVPVPQWRTPPSWRALVTPAPLETSLFM